MVQLCRKWKKDPSIVELAGDLVKSLPQGDKSAEARAVQRFVRDCIRYTNDPRGVEWIRDPKAVLEMGVGDCDDKSLLCATLLESIGCPTRFGAVWLKGSGRYSHVCAQGRLGKQWYWLETIKPVEAGWRPRDIERVLYAHN
jgi:transglutaminase-like putative cysteine protease